uniref:Uncharacterized protein n=1 Tax=Candidatus Kentrum sp. TUN TaxID=2126343 RepID=A0A450ZZ17_9GAMM|nr:MAG: hypothetical protein BECKTUN1418F_GA0071002_11623 [Candidatus Kentron sp. TUN]VFK67578.1 MAG: hypothetical protein BECKTUN1418E_GA0071001_11563 [Candidatus Kentron sp. TUN]
MQPVIVVIVSFGFLHPYMVASGILLTMLPMLPQCANISQVYNSHNKRFEALAKRIDRLVIWSFGITMGTGSLVVAALKILL